MELSGERIGLAIVIPWFHRGEPKSSGPILAWHVIIIDEDCIINLVVAAWQCTRKRKRIRVNDIGLFRYCSSRIHFSFPPLSSKLWWRCHSSTRSAMSPRRTVIVTYIVPSLIRSLIVCLSKRDLILPHRSEFQFSFEMSFEGCETMIRLLFFEN